MERSCVERSNSLHNNVYFFYSFVYNLINIMCDFPFFFKKRNSRCGRISYIQDKALFKQIITKDLPESFIYDYLKNHDFGEPVSVDDLKALMDFEWIVDNPQYKFNNPRLEQIKSDLLSSIKSFKDYLLRNTTENEFGRLIISDFILSLIHI